MMTRDGRAAELSAAGLPTLYIDFDGTLHESARVYGPAFRSVYEELTDDGLVPPAEITEEMICTWLGTPSRYPWDLLAPDLDPVLRDAAVLYGRFREMCGSAVCGELKGRDTGVVLCDCDDCVRNAVSILEQSL